LRVQARDEVGVAAVAERGAVLRLAPAADKRFVSVPTLGGHDEVNVSLGSASEQ
jgi:hypothetical protein